MPFYLATGKKLKSKEAVIIIEFKETKEQHKWGLPFSTNKLYIKIAPEDGISVSFNSKVPGLRNEIKEVTLNYGAAAHAVGNIPEAYERLILDATEGSKTLFTRWDEIELLWKFTDKVKALQGAPYIYTSEQDLTDKINEVLGEKIEII